MAEDLSSFDLGLPPLADRWAKRLLGLKRAQNIYEGLVREKHPNPGAFCENALKALGLELGPLPPAVDELRGLQGPVILAANHPFGAVDALVLMALMGRLRGQFKFVGNSILTLFPELEPALLPVRIQDDAPRSEANVAPLAGALRHLKNGGMLGMFPSGEVAALNSWRSTKTVEHPWHPHLGRFVRASRATVVPIFFEGRNGLLFQYGGLAVRRLRIALLAREMFAHRAPVRFRIGTPVRFEDMPSDAERLTLFLREKVFALDRS